MSELHDPSGVDQDVDATERGLGRIEHRRDVVGAADVGLERDRLAGGRLDLANQLLGGSASPA